MIFEIALREEGIGDTGVEERITMITKKKTTFFTTGESLH